METDAVKKYFSNNAAEWVKFGHEQEGDNYPVGRHRNRTVKRILQNSKQVNSVLDVGCGGGNLCVDLASTGYNVIGVDESLEMISMAEKLANEASITGSVAFSRDSLQNLATSEATYDAVTSMGVIGYLDNDDILFDVVDNNLLSGGKFIVSCRNRLFNMFPTSKYLRREIENGTAISLLDEIDSLRKNIDSDQLDSFMSLLGGLKTRTDSGLVNSNENMITTANSNASEELLNPSFLSEIRQHTPNDLENSAVKYGFKRDALYGIHPHLLPTTIANSLPSGLYNQLASTLEVWGELEMSLIWSSVFIAVYTKE